jgi:hypothetical protein
MVSVPFSKLTFSTLTDFIAQSIGISMRMAGPRSSMRVIAARMVAINFIYSGLLFEFGSEGGCYGLGERFYCLSSLTVDNDDSVAADTATAQESEAVLFVSEGDVVVVVLHALVVGCLTHIEKVLLTACHYRVI